MPAVVARAPVIARATVVTTAARWRSPLQIMLLGSGFQLHVVSSGMILGQPDDVIFRGKEQECRQNSRYR